jgi:uncharacterized protein (TIGR02246 family)
MTVEELYNQLIDAWNRRDADAFAGLFVLDGETIGFDGTQHTGRGAIAEQLKAIFASHPTQPYVTKIQSVVTVTTDVAIVRAVAGMAPPGKDALEPKLTAIQRLTSVQRAGIWQVALFQTTPAQYHGRADDLAKLTAELEAVRRG